MGVLLRGGLVIGPDFEPGGTRADVAIRDGYIEAVGQGLQAKSGDRVIDCDGRLIVPGLVDLWCRLGEPGYEYREDIETGTRAAAAGGYVAVCPVPDCKPINDTRAVTELILQRARGCGTRVWPQVALTKDLAGQSLAELGELADAGAVAACNGEAWPTDSGLARRAFEYARTFGLPVVSKPLEPALAGGGIAHEGPLATRLGLAGVPVEAETVALARDLELAALTGVRLIAANLSSRRAVELVAAAKKRGTDVVATVSVAHLILDENAYATYDANAKLVPPLRSSADREALIQGLRDSVIDCIVSDHDPKLDVDKEHEFGDAEPGAVGFETAFAAVLELVDAGEIELERAVNALAVAPRRALGQALAEVKPGSVADLCIVARGAEWQVTPSTLLSRSRNTTLIGRTFKNRVHMTLVDGEVVYEYGAER